MKTKIIFALRLAWHLLLLAGMVYSIYQWPWQAIPIIIMLGMLEHHWKKEYWEIALFMLVTTVISCLGGAAMLYVLHLIFTGELIIYKDSLWSIGFIFTFIYTFALIVEEDQQRPYIWIWKQMKKLHRCITFQSI